MLAIPTYISVRGEDLKYFYLYFCTFHYSHLTQHDFTPDSILLPTSISARGFKPGSIVLGVLFMLLLKFYLKV